MTVNVDTLIDDEISIVMKILEMAKMYAEIQINFNAITAIEKTRVLTPKEIEVKKEAEAILKRGYLPNVAARRV